MNISITHIVILIIIVQTYSVTSYFIGKYASSLLNIKSSQSEKYTLGILVSVLSWALFVTGFKTAYIGLLPLLGFVLYRNKKNNKSSSVSTNKPFLIEMLILNLVWIAFFTFLFTSFDSNYTGLVSKVHSDNFFYGQVSQSLYNSGVETIFLNYTAENQFRTGLHIYHFFELYLNSVFYAITKVNPTIILMTVTTGILTNVLYLNIKEYAQDKLNFKPILIYIIAGIFIFLFTANRFNFFDVPRVNYSELLIASVVKLSPVYISLFVLGKKLYQNQIEDAILVGIISMYISPVLFGPMTVFIGVLLLYFLSNKKLFFYYLSITSVSVLTYFSAHYFWGVKANNNSSFNIDTGQLFSNIDTIILNIFDTLSSFLLFNIILSVLIVYHFVTVFRKKIKPIYSLLVLVSIAVIFEKALENILVQTWQFNQMIMGISFWVLMVYIIIDLLAQKKVLLRVFLILFIISNALIKFKNTLSWNLNWNFMPNYHKAQFWEKTTYQKASLLFVSETDIAFLKTRNLKKLEDYMPEIRPLGEIFWYQNEHLHFHSIELEYLDLVEKKFFGKPPLFSTYHNSNIIDNSLVAIEKQLAFIQLKKIRYLLIGKDYPAPKELLSHFKWVLKDPHSGVNLYQLKDDFR